MPHSNSPQDNLPPESGGPDVAAGDIPGSSRAVTLWTALAAVLALWIFVSTIVISRAGWVPIPIGDDWDRWLTYVRDHLSLWWLFQQHVDHRLVVPKLLFAIDQLVFHGRGWFLLLCSFCCQALTGTMLWWLSRRAYRQNRTESILLAAWVVSCVFSAQQWINFIWPFQVQFPMVYCFAAAALCALWKSAEQERRNGAPWLALSIVMAALANYSMANGVLVWPTLLLAAFWLRLPRRWIGVLVAGALLFGAPYFYHWHRTFAPVQPPASERLPRAVLFGLDHLGSPTLPLASLSDSDTFRLAFAAIPGALLAVALVIGFVTLWRRRERYTSARAILMFYCVFIGASSATMAYGRSDGVLVDVFSARYLTPAYLLWVSLLLAAWPLLLRRAHRTALYAAVCATILIVIAIHQHAMLITVEERATEERLDSVAVVDNVTDPEAWLFIYHTPRRVMDTVDYMRNNRLTIFTEEWTHWPDIPLNRRFSIDRTPGACQGEFEKASPVSTPLKPGWRTTGWAWDNKTGRSPRYVILADDAGLIAGVALTGAPPPPALAALPQRYVASTWKGYVAGQPRLITAYVLEADERSLCAIGTQNLHGAGSEVDFKQLGPQLPDTPPETSGGAWAPDGYYKGPGGPGVPPVDGKVYGSFPDAAMGSIRLGPFHLDGHTGIAIPVVTGPDGHNLSIAVRDAVSKEVFSQLAPVPTRNTWWAWRPSLPQGREITIEVFAEDQGSGWGQWLAVGSPHALR